MDAAVIFWQNPKLTIDNKQLTIIVSPGATISIIYEGNTIIYMIKRGQHDGMIVNTFAKPFLLLDSFGSSIRVHCAYDHFYSEEWFQLPSDEIYDSALTPKFHPKKKTIKYLYA